MSATKIIATPWQDYPYKRMYFFAEINGELTEIHLWSEDLKEKRQIFEMPYKYMDAIEYRPNLSYFERIYYRVFPNSLSNPDKWLHDMFNKFED